MATGHSACSHKGSKSQKTPNSQHFLESPKISEMPASRFASWGCYIKVSKGCSRYIHINTHTQHDTHIWEMLIVLFPLSIFPGSAAGAAALNMVFLLMFDSSNRECRIDNVIHWNPNFDPYPEGFFWLGRSYISIKTIIFGGQTKETKAK